MALGLAGVVALVGLNPLEMTPVRLLSVGGSLLSAMCYGAGGVIARKRFAGTPSLALTIGQQLAAGAIMLPLALLAPAPVSYTHLRAHETVLDIVCRLLLEKKKEIC